MPVQPSTFSGGSIWATTAVTSDRNAFLTAAAGRRLVGFEAALPVSAGNCRFRIVKGAVATSTTGTIGTYELTTNDEVSRWFGDAGIDVDDGVSLDHVNDAAGAGFNITLIYKDVT